MPTHLKDLNAPTYILTGLNQTMPGVFLKDYIKKETETKILSNEKKVRKQRTVLSMLEKTTVNKDTNRPQQSVPLPLCVNSKQYVLLQSWFRYRGVRHLRFTTIYAHIFNKLKLVSYFLKGYRVYSHIHLLKYKFVSLDIHSHIEQKQYLFFFQTQTHIEFKDKIKLSKRCKRHTINITQECTQSK